MYTVVQKLSLRIVWCNLKEQASHFLVLVWPASFSITIQDSSYCPWAPKQMLVKKIQPTCRKIFLTYSEYFQLTILDWYRFSLEIPLFWSVSSLVNILFFVQRILRLPGTCTSTYMYICVFVALHARKYFKCGSCCYGAFAHFKRFVVMFLILFYLVRIIPSFSLHGQMCCEIVYRRL